MKRLSSSSRKKLSFKVFLIIFHSIIGVFAIYRMKNRNTEENPDSQFTPLPQTITPLGMELNPTTEPIQEPIPIKESTSVITATTNSKPSDENKN